MRILVLGGTYFLGRSFVKAAEARGDEVFFINRGNRREILSESELRNTYFLDRHDIKALSEVDPGHIDVLVDFCAYNEGDIRLILENAGFSIGQYIFVSTTDVYRRGTGKLPVTEDAELESRDFGGEAGGYILGKVALEKEVRKLISEKYKGVHFTVIRPAFIYGDNNYAPREGIYFKWIIGAGQILSPSDSDGSFQMAYVKDVAEAIYLCCNNPDAFDRAFNVCSPKRTGYKEFEEALLEASQEVLGKGFERIPVDVATIEEKGIPLPFPLRKEESEYYDAGSIISLGASFTILSEGLKQTMKSL